jgi:hypothetical protein
MQINDDDLQNYYLPLRPAFPEEGLEIECPNCSYRAIYQRHFLTIASTRVGADSV